MPRRPRRGPKMRKQKRLRFKPLRLEPLEPRVVLTGLSDFQGGDDALLLPFLPPLNESDSVVGPRVGTYPLPRQLPGSSLRQLPPSDLYAIEPAIVAGDPNGTPPDSPANRVDPNTVDSIYAGVGSLRISYGGDHVCTATPISPAHVLTAAHCLDLDHDGDIEPTPSNVTFNVNMGAGATYAITANELTVHPDWTGFNNPSVNDDIAIIELSSKLPDDVPIYGLNETAFDDTVEAHFVGYGRSGTGVDGYTTGASFTVKRSGKNEIDTYFVDDEGSGRREVFQFDFDSPTSGDSLGNDIETTLGGGDSGGPSFVEDADGNLLVFGVNTFTSQLSQHSPTAPYFGSGGGGIVVAAYLDFIYSVIDGEQVVITQTDGSTDVAEAGATDTYQVVLTQAPSFPVIIDIAGGTQLATTPSQLTFTPDDWDTPQVVEVSAQDDSVAEGPHVAWLTHSVTSSDIGYSIAVVDKVKVNITDNDWSLETTPYIDVGPSDNVAWDQPRAQIELIDGTTSLGPTILNSWLLDTGANTTIAFASAVSDLVANGYTTEGKFVEYGVAGDHEFDISSEYRVDFAGYSGVRHTLLNERIASDPLNDISIFGPYGIIGMPAMNSHVTTYDFTVWTTLGDELLMKTDFADEVPADPGHRYTIPVDKRMTFNAEEQVLANADPPMWADVPFLTAIAVHNGEAAAGNFIYDSGAQLSVMSTRVASAIGLDSNGDGLLDENDANFARYETVGGIGGTIDAPVFLFDKIRVPTEQGVDLQWTDLQWLVLDIADGLDGVLGFDIMTSGWIEAFAVNGQSGYIMQAQLDFRDWDSTEQGAVHLDLNPLYDVVIDPTGPGATIYETGGITSVSETGIDDQYYIWLTQPPEADVTIQLQVDSAVTATQLEAVDAANPAHDYLVFTPDNWDVPQLVQVSAINDGLSESFHRSAVQHVTSSADPNFDGVGIRRVIVNIIDDEQPGAMIIPSGEDTQVEEGGRTDTYDIVLTRAPNRNVTIRMEFNGQVTAEDAAAPGNSFLTFTPQNWYQPQTVLVTAVADGEPEGTQQTFISHFIETTDFTYLDAYALQERVTIYDSPNVAHRGLFYDGQFANQLDPSKEALLPGQTSSFVNYTAVYPGLTGLVFDLDTLNGVIGQDDIELSVWDGYSAGGFTPLGQAPTIVFVPGGGVGGSDRVRLTLDSGAVSNSWLQVRVKANDDTGLLDDDVFYFGNVIGDVFSPGGDEVDVTVTDVAFIRGNLALGTDLENIFDINKDGKVSVTDVAIARAFLGNGKLKHFTAP